MYRVKILGAGSIGNHLANAARAMGWSVVICDTDDAALERTKNDIYPSRYGSWDGEIELYNAKSAPTGEFDMIFIGTPPDSHMDLARLAVAESPKAILIEKPLCGPGLEGADQLVLAAAEKGVACFVGYDHVVGAASLRAGELMSQKIAGTPRTLDVEIREHWGGIFGAHPWLEGPHDSYLGFWRRGGGACGEHSHGINLWQHFSHLIGAGRVTEVTANMEYVTNDKVDYDSLCLANLKTENGMTGRVVQDVVTKPPRKWARVQGEDGFIEWYCGYKPGADAVVWTPRTDQPPKDEIFEKTRPDDFIQEMRHLQSALAGDSAASPISLSRGMDTMLVIAAAHRSAQEGRTVRIDYTKGYRPEALI